MSALDDLLHDIFDGKKPIFHSEFESWVRGSRRFKAFAIRYRGKIRAKLRNIRDEGGMNDLRAELETAMVLLRDERFTLEYEKYAASKQRAPDFTVTFKAHTAFNVEVRRLRSAEWNHADTDAHIDKLMAVLCDKVGQMPPGIVNGLWLVSEGAISEAHLIGAMRTLRQQAEGKTEDFFTRRGFASAADFLKRYRQLSGIVLHSSDERVLWLNTLARHKVPVEIARAIQRLKNP